MLEYTAAAVALKPAFVQMKNVTFVRKIRKIQQMAYHENAISHLQYGCLIVARLLFLVATHSRASPLVLKHWPQRPALLELQQTPMEMLGQDRCPARNTQTMTVSRLVKSSSVVLDMHEAHKGSLRAPRQ